MSRCHCGQDHGTSERRALIAEALASPEPEARERPSWVLLPAAVLAAALSTVALLTSGRASASAGGSIDPTWDCSAGSYCTFVVTVERGQVLPALSGSRFATASWAGNPLVQVPTGFVTAYEGANGAGAALAAGMTAARQQCDQDTCTVEVSDYGDFDSTSDALVGNGGSNSGAPADWSVSGGVGSFDPSTLGTTGAGDTGDTGGAAAGGADNTDVTHGAASAWAGKLGGFFGGVVLPGVLALSVLLCGVRMLFGWSIYSSKADRAERGI